MLRVKVVTSTNGKRSTISVGLGFIIGMVLDFCWKTKFTFLCAAKCLVSILLKDWCSCVAVGGLSMWYDSIKTNLQLGTALSSRALFYASAGRFSVVNATIKTPSACACHFSAVVGIDHG